MANKATTQKRTDLEMEMLNDSFQKGRQSNQSEVDALKVKIDAAPWVYEMAGKVKGMLFNEAQASFFKLIFLKQVKESKEYRERYGMTWVQFCEHVGVDWRKTDEKLADLKPYSVDFLRNFVNFTGHEFSKIKYLTGAIFTESVKIDGDRLLFDGEAIPFEPEAVQAVIEKIQDDLKTAKDERDAEKKTHERRMADEKKHITKLERSLQKFERNAHDKGLTAEEDAFLQRMDNLRTGFTGYMLQVEPTRMEDLSADNDPTVRMRAEYIATLHAMKMQILSAYDTAVEMFGDSTMLPEEGWQPGKA
ncbi:MAG: hypothetical protein HZA15_15595 [Nitrospirae bacterium]|nr:hypothetical protein [Nitrospirota bacterium]